MPEVDVDGLTRPLDGQTPSGPDLEYDPAFLEMISAAKPPQQRAIGNGAESPEEAQWPVVLRKALELAERTRDLRIAVLLTESLLNTSGLSGAAEGAAVVQKLLVDLWDSVHPRLDPAEDNDPTMRVNALAAFADAGGFLKALRTATMVQSAQAGRFSLRDHRIAQGALAAPAGSEKPDAAHIQAAFESCALEELQATAAAAARLRDALRACDEFLKGKLGTQAPDLDPVFADLGELNTLLSSQLASRTGQANGAGEPAGSAAGVALRGVVSTPADVVKRLDEICDYYRRHEPSSPVPLLLERAQRLVNKNFVEIVRDLAPAGVDQIVTIAGRSLDGVEQSHTQ
jgi:type VI secretion system protein ImpA